MGKIVIDTALKAPLGTVVVRLDNESRRNALDVEMLDALDDAIRTVEKSPDIHVMLITGTGHRAFCAGADVTHFLDMSPREGVALMRHGQQVFQRLERCGKPSVAVMEGFVLGGGLELALSCDFRIACETAQFGQPEINLANLPGWGGTQRLPRIVGEAVAKDLILTGRLMDAQEAFGVHLIHQRVPADALWQAAMALAATLAARNPSAVALAKEALHASRGSQELGYSVERLGVGLCFGTPEQRQALEGVLHTKGGRTS